MTEQNISFDMKNCLSILDFISTIPKGHKPCFRTQTTISKNGWFVTFKRRWNGEKGEYGVEYVNNVLGSCDIHYRMCLDTGDTKNLQKLSDSLKISIKGFDNLIDTYSDQIIVSDNYKKCKNKILDLYNNIDQWIQNNNIDDGYHYYEDKECYREYGTEKKPMMVSGFFNTSNITFITPK